MPNKTKTSLLLTVICMVIFLFKVAMPNAAEVISENDKVEKGIINVPIAVKRFSYLNKYILCDKTLKPKSGQILVVVELDMDKKLDIKNIKLDNFIFEYATKKSSKKSIPAFAIGQQYTLADKISKMQMWINAENGVISGIVGAEDQYINGPTVVGILPKDIINFRLKILDQNYTSEPLKRK